MRIFDQLSDVLVIFRTDDNGRLVFYPRTWFTFGKGYILPDEKTGEAIRRSLRRYFVVSLSFVFVGACMVVLTQWAPVVLYLFLIMIGVLLWFQYRITTQFTRDLTVVEKTLPLTEILRDQAKSHRLASLCLLKVFLLLLTAAGVGVMYLVLTGRRPLDPPVAIVLGLATLTCAAMAWAQGYMIWTKIRS